MNQANSIVISNREIMPGIFLLSLSAGDICSTAKPGQFVMVDCGKDFSIRRPVSIHNTENGKLDLLIKVVGSGTSSLSGKIKGNALNLIGPLGKGYSIDEKSRNILLIAGGIGIAPLLFLANKCIAQKKQVTLLMGASTADQIYPDSSLPRDMKIITATDDGSKGKKAMVTGLVKEYLAGADQVFACGPVPMYVALADILKAIKLRASVQASLEVRMGCGFGLCYGCTIKTASGIKQVCTDGPVFNMEEIDWEWLKIR